MVAGSRAVRHTTSASILNSDLARLLFRATSVIQVRKRAPIGRRSSLRTHISHCWALLLVPAGIHRSLLSSRPISAPTTLRCSPRILSSQHIHPTSSTELMTTNASLLFMLRNGPDATVERHVCGGKRAESPTTVCAAKSRFLLNQSSRQSRISRLTKQSSKHSINAFRKIGLMFLTADH